MTITYSKLHDNLDKLIEKYKENEYMFSRLDNYMENLLPTILENELVTYNERETRKKELNNNRDEFVHRFLHKNKYYYAPQTELFINYDGQHFNSYNEDDILHQILSTISYEQCLKPWKYKIKLNIMKQIRERSPLDAIPESSTIQYVINALYPSLFSSKNQVKYFLTMLGDCILNKPESNNLIYIMKPNAKELIREFSNQCYYYFGISNGFNNIKFKYYGHDYNLCRLIDMNTNPQFKKSIPSPPEMEKHILDFICVAAHYSKRYGCADNFLQECSDSELVDHILYLNKTNPDNIVKQFIQSNIKTQCNNSKLSFKNIIFLWKKYIEDCNIPNVIFYDNLKNILKQHLKYDEDSHNFLDVTSVNLPLISSFLKFWETNIIEENIFSIDDNDDMESSTTSNNSNCSAYNNCSSYDGCSAYELEIDELCSLFKKYNGKGTQANETFLLELIRHFYPDQYIENDKYLLHIRCSMWDKKGEIIKALESFKEKHYVQNNSHNQHLSINSPIPKTIEDAYDFYSKQKNMLISSKNYFERVAKEIIGSHLDDGLISNTWGNYVTEGAQTPSSNKINLYE